jgi:hypothetical protein
VEGGKEKVSIVRDSTQMPLDKIKGFSTDSFIIVLASGNTSIRLA